MVQNETSARAFYSASSTEDLSFRSTASLSARAGLVCRVSPSSGTIYHFVSCSALKISACFTSTSSSTTTCTKRHNSSWQQLCATHWMSPPFILEVVPPARIQICELTMPVVPDRFSYLSLPRAFWLRRDQLSPIPMMLFHNGSINSNSHEQFTIVPLRSRLTLPVLVRSWVLVCFLDLLSTFEQAWDDDRLWLASG